MACGGGLARAVTFIGVATCVNRRVFSPLPPKAGEENEMDESGVMQRATEYCGRGGQQR